MKNFLQAERIHRDPGERAVSKLDTTAFMKLCLVHTGSLPICCTGASDNSSAQWSRKKFYLKANKNTHKRRDDSKIVLSLLLKECVRCCIFSELPIRYYARGDAYPAGTLESWRQGRDREEMKRAAQELASRGRRGLWKAKPA